MELMGQILFVLVQSKRFDEVVNVTNVANFERCKPLLSPGFYGFLNFPKQYHIPQLLCPDEYKIICRLIAMNKVIRCNIYPASESIFDEAQNNWKVNPAVNPLTLFNALKSNTWLESISLTSDINHIMQQRNALREMSTLLTAASFEQIE